MNWREYLDLSKIGPYLALALLVIISACLSEHFLKPQNLLNITRQVSYTGIIALGMTFVIIGGGIDLSVGSGVAFIGGLTIMLINYFIGAFGPEYQYVVFFLALGCGLMMGALGGLFQGLLITKGKLAPFIATLGFMAIYRSGALHFGQGGEFRVDYAMKIFSEFGTGSVFGLPLPSLVFFALAIVFSIILNWTSFGRYVCAIGSNEKVAAYSAIQVDRVRSLTYVICGLTVSLSAFLLSGRMNSINSTNAGTLYELDAIAAVVIGGTAMTGGRGSMAGTVAGALILGLISNMLNMRGVSPYLQGTVKGLVIIFAVLIQRPDAQGSIKAVCKRFLGQA